MVAPVMREMEAEEQRSKPPSLQQMAGNIESSPSFNPAQKKEVQQDISKLTGLPTKDTTPEKVQSAVQVAQGEKEPPASKEERDKNDLIAQALIGAIPTLLGAAVGGAEGGLAGAKAAQAGIADLRQIRKEEDKEELERLQLEQKKRAQDLAFKKEAGREARAERAEARAERSFQIQTDNQKVERTNKLRQQRNALPLTKDTQGVVAAQGRIEAAAKDPSAAGDLALIFNFMKTLDPGSVVRESEFATAQNAAGVPDRIRNQYNRVLEGKRLAEGQRKDFVDRSRKLLASQLEKQNTVDKQFVDIAGKQGIAAEDVIINFADLDQAPLDVLLDLRERGFSITDEQIGAAAAREGIQLAPRGTPQSSNAFGLPGVSEAQASDPTLSVDPNQLDDQQLIQLEAQLLQRAGAGR